MNPRPRLVLALLPPFVAAGVQWLLWDAYIKPYAWVLFFPAAFFSAWLGGLQGGLASGAIGALLAWYVFIPPQFSFELKEAASGASIVLFVIMGALFGWVFERLAQAQRRSDEALKATAAANDKISRLYQKTLELDEFKSRFFANLSHELRTPLTLIMAPLENRLRRPTGADFSAQERKETEMMLRNARLLYRHVSDLLDAAKLEAGGMRVDYARVEFAEQARSIAAHFDSIARERGIAYRVAAPPTLPIEADGEKLQRILLNLLSNALKFTPDGGAIELRLATDGDVALLEVQDNGPGVPANMREAVFERFRQVEDAASRRHGGTGLGLAIVKEFAELHGGTARVSEAPGGGALFALRLPLKAPAGAILRDTASRIDPVVGWQVVDELAATATPPATDSAASHDAPLVLVVEDNADMNAFIADALRPRYRVASARDGRAGLEQALALAPDLILADVMMPVVSGDAMALELRKNPGLAGVPIVMLTAKADDALRVKLLQSGVQDYLNKPFAVDELLARVGSLLAERRRTGEQLRQSEARFAATFEQAAVGIALVTPDGRWLKVNRKLCEIVGYTPDELLTRTFQDITHPDDLEADLGQVRRMLAHEIGSYAMEKRYIRSDGGLVWIKLTVALVWQPDGAPDFFISVIEDISARKATEAALKDRNAELERFDKAAVGRELEMIRLKRQVNQLAQELGRAAPHDLSFAEPAREEKP
ncbi:MAG: PAS domain S-box protein [Rhodocyclales bacterium]|nr:PAS domain S-box protein [Rhodocyclales bacterium]